MQQPDLSLNSLGYSTACGCVSCCSSAFDYALEEAFYDTSAYFSNTTAQFSDAVLAAATSETSSQPTSAAFSRAVLAESDAVVPRAAAVQSESAIAFSDVTRQSGLELVTQTWGSAVGDFDGDNLVDIWLGGHQMPARLYRNRGDGTFEDVTDQVFVNPEDIRGDFHGAAFADFDNDGDLDLLQLAGGDQGEPDPNNPNRASRLFINENGRYRSEARGVDYFSGRGRVPVLLDPNNDGRSDYVFTGPPQGDGSFPVSFFQQLGNNSFAAQGPSGLDVNAPSGAFGVVANLVGDRQPELIYAANSPRLQIYSTAVNNNGDVRFQDITASLLPEIDTTFIQDVVVGDFNLDGEQDLFIVRQGSFSSGVREDNSRSGRARLLVSRPVPRGISIQTTGDLRLNFEGDPEIDVPQFMRAVGIQPEEIKIGPQGESPNSLVFNVDRATATGRPELTSDGVFIWYEGNEWKIALSASGFDEVNFLYRSTRVVTNIDSEIDEGRPSFPFDPIRRQSSLLIREGNRFVDRTEGSGLDIDISASNAVSGDFDNDGDLDLYVVATDLTSNLPNILFENQGNGRFVRIQNAAGASGGPENSLLKGIGDGVSVSDFDNDGDLDLFATNGDVSGFRRPFLIDSSSQLFRNDQNTGNSSVLFDLVGTESNRDGLGAQVRVTVGGQTQLLEQQGGIHNRSQNDTRLHFGLGQNTRIDRVEVRWLSGQVDVFRNVQANRIYRVTEGASRLVSLAVTNQGSGGGNTNNEITGTPADDRLNGTNNRDIIRGLAGQDRLRGIGGNDNLIGGGGSDQILGGGGNDLIVGGPGADELTGGTGSDRFLLNSLNGIDTLTDFAPNQDILRLSSTDRFGVLLSLAIRIAALVPLPSASTNKSPVPGLKSTR